MKRQMIGFLAGFLCVLMLLSACPLSPFNFGASAEESSAYKLKLVAGPGIEKVWGGGKYKAGNVITIHCVVAAGFEFVKWTQSEGSGVPDSKNRNYSFKMPAEDVTLKAIAKSIKCTVKLKRGEGIATVSGGGKYIPGETVTIKCAPASGYKFTRWTSSNSDFGSTKTEYSFKMPSENITLTARAAVKKYSVTIKKYEGIRSASGGGKYKPGDVVTVYADADSSHTFVGWVRGGELISNQNTYIFTMPKGNVTVTAKAKQKK